MMKRKLIFLLCATAVIASASACGSKKTPPTIAHLPQNESVESILTDLDSSTEDTYTSNENHFFESDLILQQSSSTLADISTIVNEENSTEIFETEETESISETSAEQINEAEISTETTTVEISTAATTEFIPITTQETTKKELSSSNTTTTPQEASRETTVEEISTEETQPSTTEAVESTEEKSSEQAIESTTEAIIETTISESTSTTEESTVVTTEESTVVTTEEEIYSKFSNVPDGKLITLPDKTTYFPAPQKEDFGELYDYAVILYDAIINNTIIEQSTESLVLYGFVMKHPGDGYVLFEFEKDSDRKLLEDLFLSKLNLELEHYHYICNEDSTPSAVIYDIEGSHILYKTKLLTLDACTQAGIVNGMTEKESVIRINNWICKHMKYADIQRLSYIAYDAFTTGSGVCSSYFQVCKSMCSILGIESKAATFPEHIWNQVKLGDKWYHLDVCWNDSPNDSLPTDRYLLSEELWEDHIK